MGRTLKVIQKRNFEDHGEWHLAKNEIWINGKINKQEKQDVLLHEAIHAISDLCALNLEERQVAVLATTILQMHRSNPELFDYLK